MSPCFLIRGIEAIFSQKYGLKLGCCMSPIKRLFDWTVKITAFISLFSYGLKKNRTFRKFSALFLN